MRRILLGVLLLAITCVLVPSLSYGQARTAERLMTATVSTLDNGNPPIGSVRYAIDAKRQQGLCVVAGVGETPIGSDALKTPDGWMCSSRAAGAGSATVSSFSAGNLAPLFTTSVATATTTPALTFSLTTQTAKMFFGGPASGSAAAPTFRGIVPGDFITGSVTASRCLRTDGSGNIVVAAADCGAGGGGTWGSITGTLSSQTDLQAALDLKAPLASPTFTGVPAAPTAAVDTNTTQLATTAYVVGQGYAKLASPTFTGTVTIPTPFTLGAVSVLPTGTELNFVDGVTSAIQTQLDGKQPLDSDLTTLAGLTATTDNFIVSAASAWASRTPAQVKTTLVLENVDNTSDATKNAAVVTLTNKTISGSSNTLSNISNASLTNSSITLNGSVISLGGSKTLTLASTDFVNQGTTTTVLHGNAAGNPSFGAVSLTADVSGDLPFANLAQGAALSVLGVTGNATADVASIAAASDDQVLRRSGIALGFGAMNLASSNAVTGALPVSNGGTGLTSGTSGGIPYFSSSTTMASSAALTANAPVIGGGVGVAPSVGTRTGNTTTFTTATGAITATCAQFDASGNLTATGAACGSAAAGNNNALYTATADATNNASITETSIVGTGVGSKTTAANYFAAGTSLVMKVRGYLSSAVTPDTLTIKIKADSTVVGTATFTLPTSLSNQVFWVDALITCRTAGATGTFMMNDAVISTNSTLTATISAKALNTSAVTLDTTGTLAWDITATWGGTTTGDTITGTNFVMFTPGTGLADPGSNGMLARTALNTTVARTITGTANQIVVTNGDGVSGNPTIDVGTQVVQTDQANTYTSGLQDFSAVTNFIGALRRKRTATAISYVVLNTDGYVGVTDTSAARTITLPDLGTADAGFEVTIADDSNGALTNNISVVPGGSDTFITGISSPFLLDTNLSLRSFLFTGSSATCCWRPK